MATSRARKSIVKNLSIRQVNALQAKEISNLTDAVSTLQSDTNRIASDNDDLQRLLVSEYQYHRLRCSEIERTLNQHGIQVTDVVPAVSKD